MYRVCDSKLQILSELASVAAAKEVASNRAREYPGQTFFVADHTGAILAGFTETGRHSCLVCRDSKTVAEQRPGRVVAVACPACEETVNATSSCN